MKSVIKKFGIQFLHIGLLMTTFKCGAFALLGPYESWMEQTNGFRQPGDIGGPMDVGSEYRWNVPVLTYGFDKSFLDYFGTNGVAAVKSAIQILNDLPPVSQLTLTNFPYATGGMNYQAQLENLYDLKSQTIAALLEQMGLAQPIRYAYTIKLWNPALSPYYLNGPNDLWFDWGIIPTNIVQRNFDPQTFEPSSYINGGLFSVELFDYGYPHSYQYFAISYPADPLNDNLSVVDSIINNYPDSEGLRLGQFITNLTYDDVGGLAYLYSTNNINYEALLPNIIGVGTNANSFVNGAWRPGVDKITFIPHPVDSSGAFLTTTNFFTDNYITNGVWVQQSLARIISQPDFIFRAGDVLSPIPEVFNFSRTGTTNWLNNAVANGNLTVAGPGVVQPQIKITFNKLGEFYDRDGKRSSYSDWASLASSSWASFDGTTNLPIVYPKSLAGTNLYHVHLWLITSFKSPSLFNWTDFYWSLTNLIGSVSTLQTSTNLTDWKTILSTTNNGSTWFFAEFEPTNTQQFYRVLP